MPRDYYDQNYYGHNYYSQPYHNQSYSNTHYSYSDRDPIDIQPDAYPTFRDPHHKRGRAQYYAYEGKALLARERASGSARRMASRVV